MIWILLLVVYLAACVCLTYAVVTAPLMDEGKRSINEK
jgi:hypothetical protein